MRLLVPIGVLCALLGLASCGGGSTIGSAESGESGAVSRPSRPKPKPSSAMLDAPPPKKLVIKDLKQGKGAAAKPGDKLTVEYVSYDYRTGKEFDAQTHHWGYGEPAVFELGAGEAVPGWDPGLKGMRVGGRRELIVPPRLAYGNGVTPTGVRRNDTVIFVFELVGIE
jgi:peptidylprolyl isomerase